MENVTETLLDLKDGASAYICGIEAEAALCNRLSDLGFLPGEQVTRLYSAPGGSPLVFHIMGQDISLRRHEASAVMATPNRADAVPYCKAGVFAADGASCHAWAEPTFCTGCTGCHGTGCPSCGKGTGNEGKEAGELTLAIVGNPNCGKTAFFNAASGGHERTGNYAGVTVTSVVGHTCHGDTRLRIVDLPGTYSLHTYSPDEAYVMRELANDDIDVIVNIIDVNRLERNLLLTLQLLRLGKPLVCVLNMYDEFTQGGGKLNLKVLGQRLGVPCVTTVARNGIGISTALDAAIEAARHGVRQLPGEVVSCGTSIGDRHRVAKSLLQDIVVLPQRSRAEKVTSLIDRFTAHGVLSLPLFVLIMVGIFWLTFEVGAYPMDWLDAGVAAFSGVVSSHLPQGLVCDLLVDGVIGGVGSVIVFLPNILILYLCISLLEDSGYLARATMLADPLLSRIGLHGKSFIPLLMGFGCNVPAVMATRTIENRFTRVVTMLAIPFMSCSARLPIYVVFCGAFFPGHSVWVMSMLYFLGIAMALVMSWALTHLLPHGSVGHLVMEIPPYRIPHAKSVLMHTWEKGRQYLRKMGGIILLVSIIIWGLGYFPRGDEGLTPSQQQEQSWLGTVGHAIQPVFAPLGFDWRMDVGILTGTGAKELMVSTLGVLYDCSEEAAEAADATEASGTRLAKVLQREYDTPTALAYMVFALFYFPCFATVIAMVVESGRRRIALHAIVYTTTIAYLMALATRVACIFLAL